MSKNLTKKESEFCCLAAVLGNVGEAAYKAGYTVFPQKKAERLLRKKQITDEIERIKEKNAKTQRAAVGLRRIAFGSCADAVKLAVKSGEIEDIGSLDLFSVSEIKYNSGKGVEIKFFDRLKALEKLAEIEAAGEKAGALSIYDALMKSNEVNEDG